MTNFLLQEPQVRNVNSVVGSDFIKNNLLCFESINGISVSQREDNILNEILSGNIPDFIKNFIEINIILNNNSITYYVSPDYICLGSNDDYFRCPMTPKIAQKIADAFNCTLPTKKMVNDIWKYSMNKLQPLPWGPPYDKEMSYTSRYKIHHDRIQKQLINKDYTQLTSGHKKDIVLSNNLSLNIKNNNIAIYGWIQQNGVAIQSLNSKSHSLDYVDYSHGVRLIYNSCLVNNQNINIQNVFISTTLSQLLSDEGVLTFMKY